MTITALDGGSNPLRSTATVHIQVEDVNDNPPEFQNESYTLFVAENETSGITLIKVRQQISGGKNEEENENWKRRKFVKN